MTALLLLLLQPDQFDDDFKPRRHAVPIVKPALTQPYTASKRDSVPGWARGKEVKSVDLPAWMFPEIMVPDHVGQKAEVAKTVESPKVVKLAANQILFHFDAPPDTEIWVAVSLLDCPPGAPRDKLTGNKLGGHGWKSLGVVDEWLCKGKLPSNALCEFYFAATYTDGSWTWTRGGFFCVSGRTARVNLMVSK